MNRRLKTCYVTRALWLLFSIGGGFSVWGAASGEGDADPRTLVQIEVVSQLHDFGLRANYAYHSPYEEYLHFEALLKKKLEPFDKEFKFVISRFPSKNDPQVPEVRVYLNDWRSYRSGEIRAILGVKVAAGNEIESVGVFLGESVMMATTISSLRDQRYAEAMNKACDAMLLKLKSYFSAWKEEGNSSRE